MDIGVLGISYKSSELICRESFAKVSCEFLTKSTFFPVVLLSTCNRTEIYFSSTDLMQTYADFLSLFNTRGDFEQRFYCYFGEKCFDHLAKVTSGVDSVLFGEAEIQGQVKRSYERDSSRQLPSALHYLFQKSLKIGKEIRTKFSLPRGLVSLESTLWDLSRCFFSEKMPVSLLLVGYSEINKLIISFFKSKGVFVMQLATRQSKNELSPPSGTAFFSWDDIDRWVEFDMVICASHSSEYIIKANQLPKDFSLLKTRLVVDLGLPRNVDPMITKNPQITLFNIEEINKFIEEKQQHSLVLQKDIQEHLEKLVKKHVVRYLEKKKRLYVCA